MRRFFAALAVVLALAWLGSFMAVLRASRHDAAERADAIVVLGAAQYNGRPSPVLKARLDHAAALYRRGLAPLVVVTGGTARGDVVSEAAAGRRYLLEAGLPDSAVRAEETGSSTEPSLRAAALEVKRRGGMRVVLVSDGFHLLRLTIVARRLGLTSLGSPAPDSPIRANGRKELAYLLAESFKAPAAFLLTRSR
jgi:uncharacterized SAM-binding protein YcdF (DUF218 family)